MKNNLILMCIAGLILSSCRFNRPAERSNETGDQQAAPTDTSIPSPASEPQVQPLQFSIGRNDYTIFVDDTQREFIIHVPIGYDPNMTTPVVVMCHGSNQHPNNMYENTSWVRKADEENIIVVFPASWKYPLTGENGLHEKWNTPGTQMEIVPGTELKDDLKFIRTIIEDLRLTFNVDEDRIFASGFSNGGGFVLTRLLPEMNDVFAAYSTSGAGLIGAALAEDLPFRVSASLISTIGTDDNKLAEGQAIPLPFPFAAEDIVRDPHFGGMLQKTTSLLSLDMSYTAETEPPLTTLNFKNSLVGENNEYIFIMIHGIGHVYPSGDNRAGVDVADLFWDFFLRHPNP